MPASLRRLLGLTALAALAAACSSPIGRAAPSSPAGTAVVVHVDDGDTIDVLLDGERVRVRLIGIDTPETKKPDTPVQCFGPEASAFTEATLPEGTEVRLERDAEARDPYGRLLAYVYRASDGLFVNRALADGGFARELSIAPNTAHADEFADAVTAARKARTGLWGACPSFGSPASPPGAGAAGGG